jgi:hypothetical protein
MSNETRDILPAIEVPPHQITPEQQAEQLQSGANAAAAGERAASLAVEQGLLAGGMPQTGSTADPATIAVPTQDMAQAIPQVMPPAAAAVTPATADDADLIEKEWVLKAKEIVRRTQYDPHIQNREMTKIRADYLKKRYNKELKVAED